uniref:Aspartate beta-hydroxylase n=1 Tax=Oncorhynchus tshawytscha TaxID=74940 RepID=A0A8C8EWK0_ONCTS
MTAICPVPYAPVRIIDICYCVLSFPEVKPAAMVNKNGVKAEAATASGGVASGGGGAASGFSGTKIFTWFMVLALLGVWSSVAVVWLDLVDYDNVIGKLSAYDADGDGDFDVEDAKVLLGKCIFNDDLFVTSTKAEKERLEKERVAKEKAEKERIEKERVAKEKAEKERLEKERVAKEKAEKERLEKERVAKEKAEKERLEKERVAKEKAEKERLEKERVSKEKAEKERLEKERVAKEKAEKERLAKERVAKEKAEKERIEKERVAKEKAEKERLEKERVAKEKAEKERIEKERVTKEKAEKERLEKERVAKEKAEKERLEKERVAKEKKKKPKLLNTFEKTIKSEIDAAEKLRKKGKVEEAVRAFDTLVQQYPQSPRCRYGKALAEDDLAEKMRSNDMLQKALSTYKEASELPNATPDLIKATLKKRAERQQFLGRMRGALATLEKLVQIFPEDMALKNDLGVAHLLIGDNKSAKRVYEEVLAIAPSNGFAKVHYGFILKSENKIAESIPFLRDGLESGDPGTDDGRFYFHLGDALQRMGDDSAYKWYERGHQRGHFASVWQRSLYNVDGLKAQPWWTPKDTGYMDLIKTLERNWRTIRDEALSVMDQTTGLFVPEEENLREKGEWGQFTLWQQGESCHSVPKTCGLLERYPEATGCKRGQIKFSVMQPGTHVWPHTGPTNCRLRMHLGLVIPKTGCKIRCTNDTRAWEEGKVLIFDDSFEHEVWQDANSYRLIFIVDVWHPELTQYQRQTLSPI